MGCLANSNLEQIGPKLIRRFFKGDERHENQSRIDVHFVKMTSIATFEQFGNQWAASQPVKSFRNFLGAGRFAPRFRSPQESAEFDKSFVVRPPVSTTRLRVVDRGAAGGPLWAFFFNESRRELRSDASFAQLCNLWTRSLFSYTACAQLRRHFSRAGRFAP